MIKSLTHLFVMSKSRQLSGSSGIKADLGNAALPTTRFWLVVKLG